MNEKTRQGELSIKIVANTEDELNNCINHIELEYELIRVSRFMENERGGLRVYTTVAPNQEVVI